MSVFCAILIIGVILDGTQSLKCYVCNSAFNEDCQKTPPSKMYLHKCTQETAQSIERNKNFSQIKIIAGGDRSDLIATNYSFCRKSVTEIPKQQNKKSVRQAESLTIRSCGWIGQAEDACKWGAIDGTPSLMCTCRTNDCNSSPGLPIFISSVLQRVIILWVIVVNLF